ncbi:MAG: HAD-IIIC family phosphatase [Paludibacteraceae bacterium]|nr:HAD-IIIC family phosphatase [Paludibacteraceae bacterium]
MIFVFRNNTIEQFLGTGYQFAGYDDVSQVPDADAYLWWYQVPLRLSQSQLVEEVKSYPQKLQFVANRIEKTFYIFLLVQHYFSSVETGNGELSEAIDGFNSYVRELARSHTNVKVIEFGEFTCQFKVEELIDWRYFFTAQIPYNPQLIRPFKNWWIRKQEEVKLIRKKCLVLDLDNTLWGGVLGEDGINGISLSGDYPGKVFHYWQEGLKDLQSNGVMLAVCSKNNATDVEEVWLKRDDMVLKKADFVAVRINWQDKATNLKELASELNIGLDSFVFVDDNPAERELIKQVLPMVSVPDFPTQPYGLPLLFQKLVQMFFGIYAITSEDRDKTKQYAMNAQRVKAQYAFENYEDFLRSLDIRLKIEHINDITIVRAAQMTQKTNQFNLTTKRYTEDDILKIISEGGMAWTLSVEDKFGDSGITGLLIITANGVIDTMLMSCRVLGKGIEDAFVNYVLNDIKNSGLSVIYGQYIPTTKNTQVKGFWTKMGFSLIGTRNNGISTYVMDLNSARLKVKDYYKIN